MTSPSPAGSLESHRREIEESPNRHDFWRSSYATMLSDWRAQDIQDFFADKPLTVGGKVYFGADLLNLFWSTNGTISTIWNYSSVNALEPFMIERGYDPFLFMRKMLHRNNRATYMPGKVILGWFYPLMDRIFNRYDPREMAFNLIAVFTEAYLPHHLHRRIKKVVSEGWTDSYLMYASDKSFRTTFDLNFDHIAGEQIKAAPRIINLPEFEDITYVCDCRRPEDVLWAGAFERREEGLFQDGRLIARYDRFQAFADRLDFDLKSYRIPDRDILVAEEDIACSRRGRTVFYRGCAYQAPAYVSRVRHRKIPGKERKLIHHLVLDTLDEGALFGPELEARHRALVASLEKRLKFTYRPGEESMDLDGVHLIKGIPAKILRHILLAFRQGKTEFEYREFKRDFEISLGQKNANFEVRFYRLVEKLAEKCPAFRIEKVERGRFVVRAACPVEVADQGMEAAHG